MDQHTARTGGVNSLGQTGAEVRQGFRDAANWFADTAHRARGSLDSPALGVWSVRDLVGHTSRALTTVESYLIPDAEPTDGPIDVPTAVGYFVTALQAGPEQIAERGRQAGRALGDTPAQAVREAVDRVTRLVEAQAEEACVRTPFGVMSLLEYLPTRTFELTVHTCDLLRALSLTDRVPPAPAAAALRLGAELAVARDTTSAVLMALTGREPLPDDFSVLRGS